MTLLSATGLGVFGSTLVAGAVGPACTLNPTNGTAGTIVAVSCTGFTAGETVQVWWDTPNSSIVPYTSFVADANGAGSGSFKTPYAVRGAHTVYSKGVTSLTQASSIFTINSSLTLSLTSGKVGASVTFSVSGYAAAESVMLNWSPDGVNFVPIGAAFKTSNLGLGGTVGTIPDAVSGAHTVKATATTTPVQTATYTVVASVSLSPASGKVGSAATATLRGYGANEVVSVTWAGTALASLTTDPSGFGTAALKVPETVKGAYAVVGAGTSHSASATYTVAPSMSLSATSGKVGSSVTVTLNGYAANDGITLNWYKDSLTPVALATTPTSVVANSKGTATATVTIPDATNGAHNIEGKTSASSATAPFSVAYSMALTPATGASGSSVSVKLTGFKAYDAVSLNWYATATSFALATTATTNADGTVTATFNVPDGSSDGLHKVDAVAGGYSRVNQNYTVTSVAGGPNCSLSQAAGPGNTVVTVNCAGFAATEQVKVYWDSTAATALATFTAAAGAGSTTVTIPAAATQGAHALISKGQTSGSSTSDIYTVTAAGGATCALAAVSGPVGTASTLTCSGFQPSEQVKIYWDSTSNAAMATILANASGSGSVSVKAPDATGAVHSVIARGFTSGLQTTKTFTVTPSMMLSLTTGKVNSYVTITLKGYAAGEAVTANWSNDGVTFFPLGAAANTNAVGTASLMRAVPPAQAGAHMVQVTAETTPTANATYTVVPGMAITASQGKVGSSLTANMQGYDPNEVIAVKFNAVTVGTVAADATGNASLTFTIPAIAKGAYSVTGAGTTNSASATYTVLPSLALSTTSGKAGSTVTVTFTGYTAGAVITLNWYKTTVTAVALTTLPVTITADATGGATATFVVPVSANGAHMVEGKAGAVVATANFTVSYDMTLSPASAAAGSTITVTLNGFKANDVVTIRFWNTASATTDLGSVTASADGSATVTITIPATATSAAHKVSALVGGFEKIAQTFVVQ